MATLTDAKARHINPDGKPLAHGAVTGLTLHPSSTKGRGKWVLRYVSPATGKRRNAGLGTYPEISIAEAGNLGRQMREQLATGVDPLEARAEQKVEALIPNFEQAAELLHQDLLPGWKNRKHAQQWINTLKQYVFPALGSLSLETIEPRHVAEVLKPIWLEKAETAGRVKQRIHAVMAWGWAHGYCKGNPVDVVHHLLPQQQGKTVRTVHHPAMPWRDVPKFVQAQLKIVNGKRDMTRMMLEFLILTASRSGEVRGMTWNEVDLQTATWCIPADRMKAKFSHRVPLSSQALDILSEVAARYLIALWN